MPRLSARARASGPPALMTSVGTPSSAGSAFIRSTSVKPSTTVHDLKALVLSFHPVIAFDTDEEERVEQLADTVAGELQLPVFVWTLTSGLYRKPGANGTIRRMGRDG